MIYIADTADLKSIANLAAFYPIDGVTTNPSIIAKQKTEFLPLLLEIRSLIGADRMLHVQTTSKNAVDMVAEAKALQGKLGPNFYIKIPVCAEGLRAIAMLHECGIGTTATAIFTTQQALLAAKAGADFVAPYVNRLDMIGADGIGVVAAIVALFDRYRLPTKVLAASFKNVEQVDKAARCGSHAVTIDPDLFEALLKHPLTDYAVQKFDSDWAGVYGEKKILELLG